ncbi:MAG: porin family protein [Flavobacterium sp.]|nr:porin family protein [Flavobacterium sp.]
MKTKKIILVALMAMTFISASSQEKGKFRGGLDFGYVPTGGGGGVLFSIEPKFNLADNMNVGLRIGLAGIARDIQDNNDQSSTAKVAASTSYVGTYDYYFHKSGSSFAPFVGAGMGYYSLANIEINDNAESADINPSVTGVFGGLVRAGFEWGKFRMGVEYNLLPDSDLEDIQGTKIGTVSNKYVGIHLGFYLGGGKWGK